MSERLRLLETRVAQVPDDRFAHYALALERRSTGDLDGAERGLRDVVARWPDASAAWLQLGRLLLECGRDEEAATTLRDGLAALAPCDTADARRGRREIADALDDLA